MPNRIEEVHSRIKEKKREVREISRALKDELAQHPRYPQLMEQYEKIRAEKKSIENEVAANAKADVARLESLRLDIRSDREMLADLALNQYAAGEKVEIVDEHNVRWTPEWSVAFKKDETPVGEVDGA